MSTNTNGNTYVGTIEFVDVGAGEFRLHTLDEAKTSYRLVFTYSSHELYGFLKDSAANEQIVQVRGSLPEDTVVVGGTHLPILLVSSAE